MNQQPRDWQPLVSTDWLHRHIKDPDIRIFDCSAGLVRDPETTFREVSGESDWWNEHIPGSRFINVPEVLSDKSSALRLTMLPAEIFAKRMAAYGLDDSCRAVLYSARQPMWATRVWWMLRSIGFDNVALLDGGFQKWKRESRPVTDGPCLYRPGRLSVKPRDDSFADKDEVLAAIGSSNILIVNALPPEQHRGETDISHGRLGRISSSVNVNAFDLIDPTDGTFRRTDEIHRLFEEAGLKEGQRVICYCGGGISATGNAFALTLAGINNVAVYDGSLNEWAKNPDLPMERG